MLQSDQWDTCVYRGIIVFYYHIHFYFTISRTISGSLLRITSHIWDNSNRIRTKLGLSSGLLAQQHCAKCSLKLQKKKQLNFENRKPKFCWLKFFWTFPWSGQKPVIGRRFPLLDALHKFTKIDRPVGLGPTRETLPDNHTEGPAISLLGEL